jgi:hypothetical protein
VSDEYEGGEGGERGARGEGRGERGGRPLACGAGCGLGSVAGVAAFCHSAQPAACPLSTRGGTRLVRLVRGRGGGQRHIGSIGAIEPPSVCAPVLPRRPPAVGSIRAARCCWITRGGWHPRDHAREHSRHVRRRLGARQPPEEGFRGFRPVVRRASPHHVGGGRSALVGMAPGNYGRELGESAPRGHVLGPRRTVVV